MAVCPLLYGVRVFACFLIEIRLINARFSYCSDGHTGNRTVQYDSKLKVHHNGRVNAHAALAHAFEAVPNPLRTMTMGCSAGSVGSYVWAPFVMHQYPHAKNYHLGDTLL